VIAVLLWAISGMSIAVVAPRVLAAMVHREFDPHITLLAWMALVVGTVTSIVVPVALSLLPRHGGLSSLADIAQSCWLALQDAPTRVETTFGIVGLLALAVAGARWAVHLVRFRRQRRDLYQRHVVLSRILGGDAAADTALWLPLEVPLAYSLAGRPALVVASDSLHDHLDADAVSAVLAHERAHISGRHHLLVGIAESLAFAFPWLPVMRSSPSLVRALVELDADTRAAHTHGRETVRRALQRLQPHPAPATALGIACDCIDLRLRRLSSDRPRRRGLARAVATCSTAAALPVLPVLTLLSVMALTSCASV